MFLRVEFCCDATCELLSKKGKEYFNPSPHMKQISPALTFEDKIFQIRKNANESHEFFTVVLLKYDEKHHCNPLFFCILVTTLH